MCRLVIQTQDANPKIRSGEVPRYTGIGSAFTRAMDLNKQNNTMSVAKPKSRKMEKNENKGRHLERFKNRTEARKKVMNS